MYKYIFWVGPKLSLSHVARLNYLILTSTNSEKITKIFFKELPPLQKCVAIATHEQVD